MRAELQTEHDTFLLETPGQWDEASKTMNKGSSNVFAFAVAASVLVVGVRSAAAQSNIAAAAKAFSLGQQAELGGNNRAASEHYELADRMVPSPEALRSAARARLKAGDEAMAATHAETLERRYSDEKSHQIAEEILDAVRSKLARIALTCDTPCGVVVDGGAVSVEEATSHVFYVEPGRHTIGADFGDGVIAQEVLEGQAGKEASLTITTPEDARVEAGTGGSVSTPPSGPAAPRGLKIGWFIGGAAVTVALAGVTVWSGLDVQSKNKAYEDEPTQDGLDEGRSAELRTNILIGATGLSAIATGIIAWKTRWSTPKREAGPTSVQIVPAEGGAVFVLGGRFQ